MSKSSLRDSKSQWSVVSQFGLRNFSRTSLDKDSYRDDPDGDSADRELDDYLSGIAKKGRKSRKKIDWSKAFEDDSLTGESDVTKFKPSNEKATLKTAYRGGVREGTASSEISDVLSSNDASALNLSDIDSRSRSHLQNSSRLKVHFIDTTISDQVVSDDGDGNNDLESPVALKIHSIDELLSSDLSHEDGSIASDHSGKKGFTRLDSVFTVDDLNPIEQGSNEELSNSKLDEHSFGVVMTVDQLGIVSNASEASIMSEKSDRSHNSSATKIDLSDESITEERSSSKLIVDERLSENITEESIRSEHVDEYDYTESFASDSQDPSIGHVESCENLADRVVRQSITDSTSLSHKVDDVQGQMSETDPESEAMAISQTPSLSCKDSSHREKSNLIDNQETRTEQDLSDATLLDNSDVLSKPQMVESGVQTDCNQYSMPEFSSPTLLRHGHTQTTIEPSVLDALSSYTPAALALHELMKEQLALTRSFVAGCHRLTSALRDDCKPEYQYTTLEMTKKYIKEHRPRVRTMEEAMKEVTKKN